MIIAGIDIGGTTIGASIAIVNFKRVSFVDKIILKTYPGSATIKLDKISQYFENILAKECLELDAIGISCGNPLDTDKGIILSPPNLPGWDNIEVVSYFQTKFQVPVYLENDANAGCLAEYLFGYLQPVKNMVFLTMGTGMGAGLILDNSLYRGTIGNAGEIGHIRLKEQGPWGYGKEGSIEGFVSGNGISLGATRELKNQSENVKLSLNKYLDKNGKITAEKLGEAATDGVEFAIEYWRKVGYWLGEITSMIIDFINPQRVIIGSIFLRQESRLRPLMEEVIERETLEDSRLCCEIVAPSLGEELGDYAPIAIAQYYVMQNNQERQIE